MTVARENPDYQAHGIKVVPWEDELLGEASTSLGSLGAVVALVLLIACVNLANLLLARGASRRREVAVRMALGADRWQVARALLVEAAVLSVARDGAQAPGGLGRAPRSFAARCPSGRRRWRMAVGLDFRVLALLAPGSAC